MAQKVAMKVFQRQLVKKSKNSKQNAETKDPDTYIDQNGEIKKKDVNYYHKIRGIPEKDAKILVSVKRRAVFLDTGLRVPGVGGRIGWGAIIGIIPVVGDFADTALAYLVVVRKAGQVSEGKDKTKLTFIMMKNLGIGCGIGLIPMVGDIADAIFKCNARNARALETMLLKRADEAKKKPKKEGRAYVQNHTLNDTYYDSELDHREPTGYGSEPALGVPTGFDSEHSSRVPSRHGTKPATKISPRYDEQYGNMHERLGMKAAKDLGKKSQATKSGGSWFSKRGSRNDGMSDGQAGVVGGDVAPPRPARPDDLGRGNGFI